MRSIGDALRCAVIGGVWMLAACSPYFAPATATISPPTPTSTPNPNLGCTAIEVVPTADAASLLEPVTSRDFSTGPTDSAVTMLFYCDFQSPQCELFNRVLDQLIENHGPDLRVTYRLFPVPASEVAGLDKSELSARAAIAAGNQERFWEMRDLLHKQYAEWVELSPGDFTAWLQNRAEDLDLDVARFSTDLESTQTYTASQESYEAAAALGINSIPTVFVNGQLQERAALSYGGLDSTIGLIALGARQHRACPPFELDRTRQYSATLHTEKGDIVIQLLAERAPLAVNSFVFLARNGWFDGTTFHRVIPGFVAQGGDPSGTGSGGPGYYFKNEVFVDLRFDKPGVVGMANSGPDTNGSQFFITYAPQPQLDGAYTIFGQVIDGMTVVESLTPRDAQVSPGSPPGDSVTSVTVEIR
jgi:cyclophilin family peptidyl-prolyl cis-trans isomerase/protein-disulfide isomerase